MSCALCKIDSPLQNSHIIPEFYYKPAYDCLHRLNVVSSDPLHPDQFRQKGLREKLLCAACEQKISRWEDYAKRKFDNAGNDAVQDGKGLLVSNIDYNKFRLFQFSLLWRMSVSKLDFFEEVNLGIKHEKALRLALINETPLEPWQYPCAIFAVLIDGTFGTDVILRPKSVRGPGYRGYGVLIGGFLFQFFVMSHRPPLLCADICISKANKMRIPVQEVRDIPYLSEFVRSIGSAIRKRDELRGNS